MGDCLRLCRHQLNGQTNKPTHLTLFSTREPYLWRLKKTSLAPLTKTEKTWSVPYYCYYSTPDIGIGIDAPYDRCRCLLTHPLAHATPPETPPYISDASPYPKMDCIRISLDHPSGAFEKGRRKKVSKTSSATSVMPSKPAIHTVAPYLPTAWKPT